MRNKIEGLEFIDKPKFKIDDVVYHINNNIVYKVTIKKISLQTEKRWVKNNWLNSATYYYSILPENVSEIIKYIPEDSICTESDINVKLMEIRAVQKKEIENQLSRLEGAKEEIDNKIKETKQELKSYNLLLK